MADAVRRLENNEQEHTFGPLFDRYFLIPLIGICILVCLGLLPFAVKFFYEIFTGEDEQEQSEKREEQENTIL